MESLSLIHRALMLSSFALDRGKDLLAGQLFGRLEGFSRPEIFQLLSSARHWTDRPWLRPIVPCLTPPGGSLIRTLGEHYAPGWIQITPDGRRAISCSRHKLKIWNLANGICEQVFGNDSVGKSFAIASSLDRNEVITTTAEWDGDGPSRRIISVLEILDLETGRCIKRLRSHKNPIVSVAITPDGSRALSATRVYKSKDNTLKVWDVESGRCTWTIEEGAEEVFITANGRRGISMTGTSLKIWNLESGKCIRFVEDCQGPHLVKITPDDRRIIYTISQHRGLKVLDLNNGKDLYLLKGPESRTGGFVITPDGKQVVAWTEIIREQKGINAQQIWDLDTGEPVRLLEDITGIRAIFPDGEKAIDSWLRIWDLTSGVCLCEVCPQHYEAKLITITPDGKQAVTFSEEDDAIRLWDLQLGGLSQTGEGYTEASRIIALLPGNRQVVTSADDKSLQLWDLGTGNHLGNLPIPITGNPVPSLAASPDGRYLVSGSTFAPYQGASSSCDKTITIWDLERSQCLHTLSPSSKLNVSPLGLSPDGQQILCSSGARIFLWDLRGEKPLDMLLGNHGNISRNGSDGVAWIAITPDGRLGISRSDWAEVMIWDLKNRCFVRALSGISYGKATSPPLSALLADGRRLLTSGDGSVKVWDLDTGECLREVNTKHGTYAGDVLAVTPHARQVVVDNHTTVDVFDLETGNGVYMSRGERPFGRSVGYLSADGKHLLVRHDDGLSEIFDLEGGKKLAEFVGEGNGGDHAIICDNTVMYVDKTRRAYFLALENVKPGAPVITAWREMPTEQEVAFGCPDCLTWSEAPASTLGAETPCPQCGKPVKLNPFVIDADWRPVAAAWRGEKPSTAATSLEPAAGAVDEPVDSITAGSAVPPAQHPKPEAPPSTHPASTEVPAAPAPARRNALNTFAQKIKTALGKEHPRG